jgi:hypothetical protein
MTVEQTSATTNREKLNFEGNNKEDTKLMKTLRNLKISPRKMFKSYKRHSELDQSPLSIDSGNFQSYNKVDRQIEAFEQMGDFLNSMREVVEKNESTKAEEEPIYVELSPKNNKTIINEYISENNNRYLIVNNDPKAIYATVNKVARSKSMSNADCVPSKTHVARNLFSNKNEESPLQTFDRYNTYNFLFI